MSAEMRKGFRWGIGSAIVGIAIAWLLGIANNQELEQKASLEEMHKAEIEACIAENGECRIEYLRDRTNTIYAAKVVKVEE